MYQHILVPIDASPTSKRGLEEAIEMAKLTGGSLRLMHVVDEFSFATGFEIYVGDTMALLRQGGEQILKSGLARVEASGVKADTLLSESVGNCVSDLVVEEAKAWKADLIVIGTHGRRGVGRLLLGSDAERIVREAPVPVLLVRPSRAEANYSSPGGEKAVPSASTVAA